MENIKTIVIDKDTGKEEVVVERTVNSFNVTQTKITDKGINCTQWFSEENFNKRFQFKELTDKE